mgnify:CR=1 FL=1
MKRSKTMEFGVGLFMLAGIIGLVFLGLRVSGLTLSAPSDTFRLEANFANTSLQPPHAGHIPNAASVRPMYVSTCACT